VIHPEVGWGRAVGARGREADTAIVGSQDDIAGEGEVGAAGKTITVDFGNDWLVQRRDNGELALGLLHRPAIVVHRYIERAIGWLRRTLFGSLAVDVKQVVAGAERFAGSL
jgi:hypothetical protein